MKSNGQGKVTGKITLVNDDKAKLRKEVLFFTSGPSPSNLHGLDGNLTILEWVG